MKKLIKVILKIILKNIQCMQKKKLEVKTNEIKKLFLCMCSTSVVNPFLVFNDGFWEEQHSQHSTFNIQQYPFAYRVGQQIVRLRNKEIKIQF